MGDQEVKNQDSLDSLLGKIYAYDQAGEALKLAQPKRIVFLVTVLFILAAIILWSFLGRIPTEVVGRMVAIHPDSLLMIDAAKEGIIEAIFVKEGDIVQKDAILGSIYNTEQKNILFQITSQREKLEKLKQEVRLIQANLEIRERLNKQKLIARTIVDETKIQLIGKQIEEEETRSNIVGLFFKLEAGSQYWDKSIVKDADNAESYEKLKNIEHRLSNFYSPEEVKVLEVLVKPKDHVQANQQLFWLERLQKQGNPLLFYTTVSLEKGNRAKVGMEVYIEPNTVNNQVYGKLIGKIIEVNSFAVSEKELLNTIKNPQITKYLTEEGKPVALIIVEAIQDPSTISGFKWTSAEGPPFKLNTGTVGMVKIIVEEQPPISYLIPLWKLKPY